jgi:hypothetical protein
MSGPNENDPVQYLRVRSRLKSVFTAKFHGDEYEWSPGEEIKMSEDAARHIFGYGLKDKLPAFQRNGWLNSVHTLKDAYARLSKFDFEPVQQVFELITAKKSGGSDRPLAVDGENGDGVSSSPVPDEDAA